MQKGFAPILVLIGIIVIIAIAGGAYFLGKLPIKPADKGSKACTQEAKICPDGSSVGRSGPNCEFSPCPSATPKPIDVSLAPAGAGETANWKTYTDTENRFTLKYPLEWSVEENTNSNSWKSADYKVSNTGNIVSGQEIILFVDQNPTGKSIENWWGTDNTDYIVSNKISFKTDGYDSIKYNLSAPGGAVYGVLIDKSGEVFRFEAYATTEKTPSIIKILNQILSIFKFTDQNTTSANNSDICNLLSDSTFRSVEKGEGGLGPLGPEKIYWTVKFTGKSTFEWSYSDVVVNGSYSCANNNIKVSNATGKIIPVVYDPSQKLLEWNGIKYRKIE